MLTVVIRNFAMNPENTNPNPAQSTVGPVPSSWPGAFGLYKHSKAAVSQNWVTLLMLIILSILPAVIPSSEDLTATSALISVAQLIIGLILSVAAVRVYLAGARSQKMGVGEALNQSLSPALLVKYFVLSVLVGLSVVVGLILLIIPGLIIAARLLLAEYYIIDKNMGILEAYQASWDATKGHVLKFFGIAGAFILMALLMLTIIGIPFSLYFLFMYSGSTVVMYELLRNKQPEVPAAQSSAPVAEA